MALVFTAENHKYTSLDPADQTDWVSATTFLSHFKGDFDENQHIKSSKSRSSKWSGMDPKEILAAWATESKRATDLGNWYHDQRESDLCSHSTIRYKGFELPVFRTPTGPDGRKISGPQKLVPGFYPEHMVFLKSAGLCGQSDLPIVMPDNILDISDYKSNKEIKEKSYVNWEGISKMLKAPMDHLEDCDIQHHALQLSLYMYIIIKHNPMLKPGELTINHIIFEVAGENQYGYPITAVNQQGDPIIKDIVYYKLPYLKREIEVLIGWVKENRHLLKKKKK